MTYQLKCGCVKAHTCDAVVKRGTVKRGSVLRHCAAHGGPAADPATVGTTCNPRRRYAAGRRIQVPKSVRTVRDLIRRHMREEGRDMRDLSQPWNVKQETIKTIMHHGRPLSPQYVDAFIEFLQLDEFDAMELRYQGAIEAGWQIQGIEKARL